MLAYQATEMLTMVLVQDSVRYPSDLIAVDRAADSVAPQWRNHTGLKRQISDDPELSAHF